MSAAEQSQGRAPMTSAPGSSRGPLVWPMTLEGAHQRLDFHETLIEDLTKDIGVEPMPVSGKEGSGLMLFLHRVHVAQQAQRVLEEAEIKNRERWRMRWTIIATVFSVVIAGATVINTVRAWVTIAPPAATSH